MEVFDDCGCKMFKGLAVLNDGHAASRIVKRTVRAREEYVGAFLLLEGRCAWFNTFESIISHISPWKEMRMAACIWSVRRSTQECIAVRYCRATSDMVQDAHMFIRNV